MCSYDQDPEHYEVLVIILEVDEEVDSSISVLFVEEDVSDEDGLKLVCGGLEFPVDGCNGRYPIGNWPLKFVAKFNGNKTKLFTILKIFKFRVRNYKSIFIRKQFHFELRLKRVLQSI